MTLLLKIIIDSIVMGIVCLLNMKNIKFTIESTDGNARAAKLVINGKSLNTPAFMTIGTYGSIKTMDTTDLKGCNDIILSNAFHLVLRPVDIILKHVGLHNFMNWDGLILTDSGGYQVFSLEKM